MSTKRYSRPATASLSTFRVRSVGSVALHALLTLMLLLALVFSLLTPSYSAESNVLGVGDNGSEDSTITSVPDAFGRDTPRQTVQGFIKALGENDFLLASNYLNLSKSDNPATMVRQFKQALDSGGRFLPDLQLNNTPEGTLSDQLPPNQERVGTISTDDNSVPLILERVVSDNGEQYWQFSNETMSFIPDVIENTEPTLVSRYTIDALEDETLFGYQMADFVAALTMIVGSFIFTYLAVWLLYHLLQLAYPRVRGVPLPLPNKVVLPLSIVITALILSEIMIYAGVSVTLREPINRFTEIASWLAVTWLLLRVIDATSTRAVNISYKKNHIERIAILELMRKVFKALLLIFALIVIFGNLGFDLTTGIAALGVGGLALALGAQKTIENLVGSVVVVADSPVRIGDYCKFGDQEGTVIDIGIRSSRVRTLARTIVTVPNGDFSSMQIENFTSRDMFQFLHNLYIKRNADIDVIFKMVNDLDKFIAEHELTNSEWNQVNIMELRQDCYVIQLRAYVNSANVIEFYGKQDRLLVEILSMVKKYKVEHALPTQQLIVNQGELEQQYDNNESDVDDVESAMTNALAKDSNTQSLDDNQPDADIVAESDSTDVDRDKKNKANKRRKKGTLHSLRKRTFKQAKKKYSLSIWNPHL